MADDVVITGLGVVSPVGCGEKAFWDALCAGRSGAAPVPAFEQSGLSRTVACRVPDLRPSPWPMGRAARLAVAATEQATGAAALDVATVDRTRLAVVVGTTMGETDFIENRIDAADDAWLSPEHAAEILQGRPGSIAANVSRALGADTAGTDLYGACAAGNLAITVARRRLLDGDVDVAIAGGADGFSRLAFYGFMRARVMAAGVCRPFDQSRDGLLVGEGAAVFVLERESHARARGAPIRARVAGAAATCENYHPTRPEPNGDGLGRATTAALRDAGLTAEAIDYVCAHGTGTPHNDAIEVAVMQRCLRENIPFSSIKALTGHTMGAAAAIEAACCVLSLEQGKMIPTWHLEELLEPCPLDAVRGGVRAARLTHVMNNSAGFGGYNSSLVLSAA